MSGAGLALLLAAGGAMSLSGSENDGQGFNLYSKPMMQYGGTVEQTLQIIPPVHDAIWPPIFR